MSTSYAYRLRVLLLVALALLLVSALVEVVTSPLAREPVDRGPLPVETGEANDSTLTEPIVPSFDSPMPEALARLHSRPLFRATRRPPNPALIEHEPDSDTPSSITVPPTPLPAGIRLVGVVINGHQAVALVEHPSELRTLTVRVGDRIEAWIVTAIDSGVIKLTNREAVSELELFQAEAADDATERRQGDRPRLLRAPRR